MDEKEAIARLARALQFRTISSNDSAETQSQFQDFHTFLQSSFPNVYRTLQRIPTGNQSLLFKWEGRDLAIPPLLFLAHQDVVPANEAPASQWRYPPFEGRIADGFIWGRGAMDDKSALLAILEAIETLIQESFQPASTMYFGFGHDEEIGGERGAQSIAEFFRKEKVRFQCIFDEGLCITQGLFPGLKRPLASIGVGQKGCMNVRLIVKVPSGHASLPPTHTAIGILSRAIAQLEAHPLPPRLGKVMRALFSRLSSEMTGIKKVLFSNVGLFGPLIRRLMTASPRTNAFIRTTLATTLFHSGTQANVLPSDAEAVINVRMLPGDRPADVLAHIRRVIQDPQVEIQGDERFFRDAWESPAEGPVYCSLETVIHQIFPEAVVAPGLVAAATDARYFVDLAEAIYHFRPQIFLPEDLDRFHGDNERIPVDDYKRSIVFWKKLMQTLQPFVP